MGLEQARQALEQSTAPSQTSAEPSSGGQSAPQDNGSLAPDSASSTESNEAANSESNVFDLTKANKFLWEGKEMTPEELRKAMLRQQDYTKKTQAHAEERRKFEEERRSFIQQQEEKQKFDSNLDADIQNVLKNPTLADKFKEIYPESYHRFLDQALNKTFGDQNDPKRNESILEQRLKTIENNFQQQNMERARQAFETEVSKNSEILESSIQRLSNKYPLADEDSVLARSEHMAAGIKKDENFNDNFFKTMEKLYAENHKFHESRYREIYKEKVEKQKQKNSQGRDIGRGGATPGTAPQKMKLKDVKNHILANLER
jgi:hypothetical protein